MSVRQDESNNFNIFWPTVSRRAVTRVQVTLSCWCACGLSTAPPGARGGSWTCTWGRRVQRGKEGVWSGPGGGRWGLGTEPEGTEPEGGVGAG